MNKIDLISIDLGKTGGMALWSNLKCVNVISWEIGNKEWMSEHLFNIAKNFEFAVQSYKCPVAVERPSRYLPHQWVLYSDLKTISEKNKVDFFKYMPMTIKKQVTGYGRANKEDIQNAVLNSGMLDFNVKPDNEHMFDCIGVGITHFRKTGQMTQVKEVAHASKTKNKRK